MAYVCASASEASAERRPLLHNDVPSHAPPPRHRLSFVPPGKENEPGPGAYTSRSGELGNTRRGPHIAPKRKQREDPTPGPGSYTAPAGIGARTKGAALPKAGLNKRQKKDKPTPGPGDYLGQKLPGTIGAEKGKGPIMVPKPKPHDDGPRPGVGDYEVPPAFAADPKKGARIVPRRDPATNKEPTPAPGEHHDDLGALGPKKHVAAPLMKTPVAVSGGEEPTPAPGDYNTQVAPIGKNAPAVTMGLPAGSGEPAEPTPGPGDYTPAEPRPQPKGVPMGPGYNPEAAKKPEAAPAPTPGPGDYNTAPAEKPKGTAVLGPGYDPLAATNVNVPVGAPTPGPGDYNAEKPEKPKGTANLGPGYDPLAATQKPKQAAPTPGPGDYAPRKPGDHDVGDPNKPGGYKMGDAPKAKKESPAPGPGDYSVNDPMRQTTGAGPTYDMGAPSKPKRAENKPGPGDYDPFAKTKEHVPGTLPMGPGPDAPRAPKRSAAPAPGPGDYDPVDPLKEEAPTKKYAMGERPKPKRSAPGPGVGDYDPVDPVKQAPGPTYDMGRKPAKTKKAAMPTPGPGDYSDDTKKIGADDGTKKYAMGKPTAAPKKSSDQGPGPGDYDPVDPLKQDSGTKKYAIGKPTAAPKKSSDQGPGPGAYDVKDPVKEAKGPTYAMGKPPPKKKASAAPEDAADEGPGPGQYNLDPPKDNKKFSMGTRPAEPVIVEAPQPGPGQYSLPDPVKEAAKKSAYKMGPGFGKDKSTLPPQEPEPAPGPGTYYPAPDLNDGPKFTMGAPFVKPKEKGSDAPPPGTYDVFTGKEMGADGPAFSMGVPQAKPKSSADDAPAPGDYDVPSLNKGIGPHFGEPFDRTRLRRSLEAPPPDTGPGPHEYQYGGALTGKDARATGFGPPPPLKRPEDAISDLPGPGEYNDRTHETGRNATAVKIGPGFGQPTQHYIASADPYDYDGNGNLYSTEPGPADYAPINDTVQQQLLLPYHRQAGTVFASRTADRFTLDENADNLPAPGEYVVPGHFGVERPKGALKTKGPLFGTAPSRAALAELTSDEANYPGPAEYAPTYGDIGEELKKPLHMTKGRTMGTARANCTATEVDGDDEPGPGDAFPLNRALPDSIEHNMSLGKGARFRTADVGRSGTAQDMFGGEAPRDDEPGPHDYDYTADNLARSGKGVKFGRDPRKLGRDVYDDDDDVPADGMLGVHVPPDERKPEVATRSAGPSRRRAQPTPGPGAYDVTRDDLGAREFTVVKAPDFSRGAQRDEPAESFETPGPGPAAPRLTTDSREIAAVSVERGPTFAAPSFHPPNVHSHGQKAGRGYGHIGPQGKKGFGQDVKGGAFAPSRFDHVPRAPHERDPTPGPDEYRGPYMPGDIGVGHELPRPWQKGSTFGKAPARATAGDDDAEPAPVDTAPAHLVRPPDARGGVIGTEVQRPLSARERAEQYDPTPGPGDHFPRSDALRAPAPRFGKAPRAVGVQQPLSDTPAPGDTHTDARTLAAGAKRAAGPSFAPAGSEPQLTQASGGRALFAKPSDTPGPGHTSVERPAQEGDQWTPAPVETRPGDTAYGAKANLAPHMKKGASFGAARKESAALLPGSQAVPGPGQYDVVHGDVATEQRRNRPARDRPGFTMAGRPKERPPAADTPGPGAHDVADAGYDVAGYATRLPRNQRDYDPTAPPPAPVEAMGAMRLQ